MSIIQGTSKAAGGGYEIDQSIRFNFSDAAHMLRTPSSASNRRTWTWSLWVKRSGLGNPGGPNQVHQLFGVGAGSCLRFTSADVLRLESPAGNHTFVTSQVFRDTSAWYHIVLAFDSTQATDTNRRKLYVNGSQVTDFSSTTFTELGQNAEWDINSTSQHQIAKSNLADYFGGYLAELNFIDGTALDPTDFGEYNDDGVWIPKAYTGSYGTNGFYITGEDSTFLGQDVRTSGDQVNSFQAAQWTGATGSYTFTDGGIEADASNKAIKTVDTFTGDFEFSWRYVNMANFIFGLYEIDEDGTFSDSSSAGNMQNMTDSWYVQTSSVAANRDIKYGGTTVVDSTTIANGDVWKMTRESGTIKVYRNSSLVHTFTQTSTNEVRLVVAQGDAAADANQVNWVDNSTLGNNFFSSGLATTDQMLDTPTNNFCVLNPLKKSSANTISDGNLTYATTLQRPTYGTIGVSSGKWYWEWKPGGTETWVGIGSPISPIDVSVDGGSPADVYVYGTFNGNFFSEGSGASYGATAGSGDVIGIALDLSSATKTLTFYKNNSTQGTALSGSTLDATTWIPVIATSNGVGGTINWGQSAFTYTPPTGFNALSTANLPTPSITDGSKYFQPTIYTGNGTAIGSGGLEVNQSGNSTFQPDFAWIKNRTTSGNEHDLYDVVRGATKVVFSSTAGQEATVSEGLTSFDSDGFTVGNRGEVNTSGNSMVAWQWLADNTTGSSNTDGSVTSTVSNNSTSNFSIAKYTGTGSGSSTVGHGLGVTPDVIIVKHLDRSQNWRVFHTAAGVGLTGFLNSTAAFAADPDRITAVSSTTFTAGANMNESADYISYCFAEIPGYSSFGSYEGNSSTDGTFVYTGFTPSFILTKNIDTADQWGIRDTTRNPFNVTDKLLNPNASTAETSATSGYIDILSNGFKPRSSDSNINTQTIIYMAFAENPFGGDGAAPATAR